MQNNLNQGVTDIVLLKHTYFMARARIYNQPTRSTLISIRRRDTLEPCSSFTSMSKDIKELQAEVYSFINKLEKPIDWKAPHRYCIAYYSKMISIEDDFCDYIRYKGATVEDWWKYQHLRLLKETVLIKKVNALSQDERKRLLTIADWELEFSSYDRIIYGIHGRDYLYKRLFDKKGLKDHYKEFKRILDEFSSSFDV